MSGSPVQRGCLRRFSHRCSDSLIWILRKLGLSRESRFSGISIMPSQAIMLGAIAFLARVSPAGKRDPVLRERITSKTHPIRARLIWWAFSPSRHSPVVPSSPWLATSRYERMDEKRRNASRDGSRLHHLLDFLNFWLGYTIDQSCSSGCSKSLK